VQVSSQENIERGGAYELASDLSRRDGRPPTEGEGDARGEGTLMEIPAMLAFDTDQTWPAEVGRIFLTTRPPADSRVPGEEEASGYW